MITVASSTEGDYYGFAPKLFFLRLELVTNICCTMLYRQVDLSTTKVGERRLGKPFLIYFYVCLIRPSLLSPLGPFLIWLNTPVLVLSRDSSGVGRMGMGGKSYEALGIFWMKMERFGSTPCIIMTPNFNLQALATPLTWGNLLSWAFMTTA